MKKYFYTSEQKHLYYLHYKARKAGANIDRKKKLLYLPPGVLPEHLDRWQRELLSNHRYLIQYAIL